MSFIINDEYNTTNDLSKPFNLEHKTVKSIRTTKKGTKGTKYTVYFNNIITIYPNEYIYIVLLEINPTINATGTIILEKYKNFGQINNFKYIKLCDSSTKLYNICENRIYYSIISLFLYGKTWYQSHGFEYESNLIKKENYFELNKNKMLNEFITDSSDIETYRRALPDIITSDDITILNIIENLNFLYLLTNNKMTHYQCNQLNDLLLELTVKILSDDTLILFLIEDETLKNDYISTFTIN